MKELLKASTNVCGARNVGKMTLHGVEMSGVDCDPSADTGDNAGFGVSDHYGTIKEEVLSPVHNVISILDLQSDWIVATGALMQVTD